MNSIFDYYNQKAFPFGLGARRRRRIMPLLQNLTGKKILDIGCATGYIGAVLKKQGNYVVGIDITKKDITKAKQVLDEAYVFDIETDDLKKLDKNFDYMIMAEVPEHLFDPEAAIARFLPLLKKNGRILLSTPNLVHFYNRVKITLGFFEYKEETVINKSHIHFFTYSSFKKAIRGLGLTIVEENNVTLPEFMAPLLTWWPNLFVFQMVFVAKKDR